MRLKRAMSGALVALALAGPASAANPVTAIGRAEIERLAARRTARMPRFGPAAADFARDRSHELAKHCVEVQRARGELTCGVLRRR